MQLSLGRMEITNSCDNRGDVSTAISEGLTIIYFEMDVGEGIIYDLYD